MPTAADRAAKRKRRRERLRGVLSLLCVAAAAGALAAAPRVLSARRHAAAERARRDAFQKEMRQAVREAARAGAAAGTGAGAVGAQVGGDSLAARATETLDAGALEAEPDSATLHASLQRLGEQQAQHAAAEARAQHEHEMGKQHVQQQGQGGQGGTATAGQGGATAALAAAAAAAAAEPGGLSSVGVGVVTAAALRADARWVPDHHDPFAHPPDCTPKRAHSALQVEPQWTVPFNEGAEWPPPDACSKHKLQDLCDVLRTTARKREVLLAVANSHAPGLDIFLKYIAEVKIPNFMIAALDEALASRLKAQGVPYWFIKNDAQGNHKVSAQKFGIVQGFIRLGCSVLLTDTDVVYMTDPFQALYRDSDIESMSDGWDNKTAHGDIEHIDDLAMGIARHVPATMRMAALNSGLWYVAATVPALRLMQIMAYRMATEDLWDQAGYNLELMLPAHDEHQTAGATVRVAAPFCFCNTKVFFRHMRQQPWFDSHLPIAVHVNYHTDKRERQISIAQYYHHGEKDALRRYTGTHSDAALEPTRVLEKSHRAQIMDGQLTSRNVHSSMRLVQDSVGCRPRKPWKGKVQMDERSLRYVSGMCADGSQDVWCRAFESANAAKPAAARDPSHGGRARTVVVVVASSEDLEELALFAEQVASLKLPGVVVVALDATAAVFARHRDLEALLWEPSGEQASAPRSYFKWKAVEEGVSRGYGVLALDPDTVLLQDPFAHLYYDFDVEVATLGTDDVTAYGYDHVVDDEKMGWSRFVHGTRQFVRDPGVAFVADTEASLALASRASSRLLRGEDERLVLNQELYLPSHGPYAASGVTVRVLNYLCFMNSKAAWRLDKMLPKGFSPVAVHLSYHARKAERMAAVARRFSSAGTGDPKALQALPAADGANSGGRDPFRACGMDKKKPTDVEGMRARGNSDAAELVAWLSADGAQFTWSGVKQVVFQTDGSVVTPWGGGQWGPIEAADGKSTGLVWADFVGAHHVIAKQGDDPDVLTSIRCSDGDLVLVRRIGAA